MKRLKHPGRITSLLLAGAFVSSPAYADDVWVYYNSTYVTAADIAPTVSAITAAGGTVTTTTTASWTQDWTGYKLIVILLPDANFSLDEAAALEDFVVAGGRLVLSGDWAASGRGFGTFNSRINDLMAFMGVPISIAGFTSVAGSGCSVGSGVSSDSVTDGMTGFYAAAAQQVSGGTRLLDYSGTTVLTVAQPAGALPRVPFDVLVGGDINLFTAFCAGSDVDGSNRTLWENLYYACTDADLDGYPDLSCGGDDCDDTDADVHPDAAETCDGLDDDCDGTTDEGVESPWFYDGDLDGYGDSSTSTAACDAPPGYVATGADCDDLDPNVRPGAAEVCDGVDQDCDGTVDDGVDQTFYADLDEDGFGDPLSPTQACSAPLGFVEDDQDCDDTESTVAPGLPELCDLLDNDCDGALDEGVTATFYADDDADGYGDAAVAVDDCSGPAGYVPDRTDCDDTNSSRSPGLAETCDGLDNDCNSLVDDGLLSAWYDDDDGDGYGDLSSVVEACDTPSGTVSVHGDCDDLNPSRNPGLIESCDGLDNDCDTVVDDGLYGSFYADRDADTYGDSATSIFACAAPSGYVTDGTDCDDTTALRYPSNAERCDEIDNDCDGTVDDNVTSRYYADADQDGYGDDTVPADTCAPPDDYVADNADCDDTRDDVSPGDTEVCDTFDNDCDGLIDEGVTLTWYADTDADGYGDPTSTAELCGAEPGYVLDDTDCWDESGLVYPGAPELADGIDGDCDGVVDENTSETDDDGDGVSELGGDCDDDDPGRNPASVEVADGLDQDCDGLVDEGTEVYDDDGDGRTETGGDCNDADPARSPDLAEIPDNGLDDDCDGVVDDGVSDPDGDGYQPEAGDCDPDDGAIYPGAPERENGLDDDCDGLIDEGTPRYDNDGDGLSAAEGDCDDQNADVHPDRADTADGLDNDCDGIVDEGTDAYDDDGDGFSEEGGDCDDLDPAARPGADELLNGVDDDCDGDTDEGTDDADGDGVTRLDGDCNDADGWVRPNLPEMCDAIDNNCDGVVDEGCDVGEVIDTGSEADPQKDGGEACGCGSGSAAWVFGVSATLGLVRRRRRPARADSISGPDLR